ncbi:MAG TPA: OB-fold domain-containing protein [Acidimicrobiia bacterium]|nr:OB-fold domain-containing protein [Acidimicrobiia bacterium]
MTTPKFGQTDTPISKRRAGEALGGLPVADPRPRLVDGLVAGWRCGACGHAVAQESPWCPNCAAPALAPASFGPGGTVWAGTVVHLPVGDWKPPFGLASVDLDDGPRILAHVTVPRVLAVASRVRLVDRSEGDDVFVEPEASGS